MPSLDGAFGARKQIKRRLRRRHTIRKFGGCAATGYTCSRLRRDATSLDGGFAADD